MYIFVLQTGSNDGKCLNDNPLYLPQRQEIKKELDDTTPVSHSVPVVYRLHILLPIPILPVASSKALMTRHGSYKTQKHNDLGEKYDDMIRNHNRKELKRTRACSILSCFLNYNSLLRRASQQN